MATFGDITNPLDTLNKNGYGSVESGLPDFISNITTVVLIAGGLYSFFNLLVAGITYISASGDQKKIESAVLAINMSLLGLIVLVGAVAITGIISFVLFGDATLILRPKIFGPGSVN
jgi:hypothetical protein